MTRAELLDRMRAGRDRLETWLGRFSDAQMITTDLGNGWTIKDLIAHLGFWEETAADIYHRLLRGEQPESGWDVDAVNAKVYAAHRDESLAEVRQWERAAYQALVELVENAPEDDLFNPQRFPWTQGAPLADWIEGNSSGHFAEHLDAFPAH